MPSDRRDADDSASRADRERFRRYREKVAALEEDRERLANQLEKLRGSYLLSGAGKKVDLRTLEGFGDVARRVIEEGRLGMSYDRLYTLWQAVAGAPPRSPAVEIGAYRGGSARFIGEALRHFRRRHPFYVCDTFSGHPWTNPTIDLVPEDGRSFDDTSAEAVAAYLQSDRNVRLVVGDITKTSSRLRARQFGFVHIDVDLFDATAFCLDFFAARLAPGGVIVVDDYGTLTCPGAQRAVDEFVVRASDFRMFHLLSSQALLFRKAV